MGSVYPRGSKLWIKYKAPDGKWVPKPTYLDVGQEKKAQAVLDRIEELVKQGVVPEDGTPPTLRRYAAQWIARRRQEGMSTVDDDEARLERYVLPSLGARLLTNDDLRPRHFRDLVQSLTTTKSAKGELLAPRTVHHIYATLHAMLQDAVVDELLETNPCLLKRRDLPRKRDKDPKWRGGAVFTRSEVEQIISDVRIPEDRRVLNALLLLGGYRFGEAAALRVGDYDPTLKPLGRMLVTASFDVKRHAEKGVKTETPRQVPVHPTLAKVLATWLLSGWQRMMGRPPRPDDLLIPSREGRHRNVNHALKRFHEDLERVGLRRRRIHDSRRSFISLALADGARKDVLKWVTHGPPGDIMDLYTTLPWSALCEAVSCLRIDLLEGKLIELPRAVAVGAEADFGTVLGTVESPVAISERLQLLRERGGRDSNPRPPA